MNHYKKDENSLKEGSLHAEEKNTLKSHSIRNELPLYVLAAREATTYWILLIYDHRLLWLSILVLEENFKLFFQRLRICQATGTK